jgi:hypothetical protein
MLGWRLRTPPFTILPYLLALVVSLACWSAAAIADEQPLYGGTMILATFVDPGALNPALTTSVPTHLVTEPIFSGLVGHDF